MADQNSGKGPNGEGSGVAPRNEAAQKLKGVPAPQGNAARAGAGAARDGLRALQAESAAPIRDTLSPRQFTSSEEMLESIAADMGMERISLATVDFTDELVAEIRPEVAKKYGVVPVRATATEIWLALTDPHNIEAIDKLSMLLGKTVHGVVANHAEIDRVMRRLYDKDSYKELYEQFTESEDPGTFSKSYDTLEIDEKTNEEIEPVVRFVDKIFVTAVHQRASDIHIEPARSGLVIRFRIDGVLHQIPYPPRKWQNQIISRIKVLAQLDLAEKRIPLDGRIRLQLPDRKLDLRVSTLPTIFGESIVMRLLDPTSVMMGLEDVGFLPESVRIFNRLIRSPNGIILMTGPTGSGKTTTLYAALGTLNTPDHKLVTLEDPVEYQIPGINQIQINQEVGLTFAAGLKALLRQSPDVLLVGEIRDLETGENAIRAALTGHLVFSTLHTNDAPSSTIRLIDMGIKPYLVASSLQAALAQRLVRRICTNCKTTWRPSPEIIREMGYDPDEYADTDFFKGKGCERCSQSGYRGRTAIHEIMTMDSDLRRRVIRSEAASRLKRAAIAKGMRTLRMDGWEKCVMGQTSIEEVMRLTQEDGGGGH